MGAIAGYIVAFIIVAGQIGIAIFGMRISYRAEINSDWFQFGIGTWMIFSSIGTLWVFGEFPGKGK